ncbi:AAA family ATPase [Prauserella muralis]|uniref:Zeta toxin n=1 Tax=Prauserella muralis TaxID=588067 RepID=A0A2V4AI62_9PSEU|nr:AAA family ATPase [Prauserella muralis]PXY19608.1 Zeta toxin [Prauserella muralis]TWE29615.1 AAA domain-containing protein [Prauserella muralis]
MTSPPTDRLVLRVADHGLVVVAGLPGAGKSTLLRDVEAVRPLTVLDTDQVRARLARTLPDGLPYSWYRPLVHVLHLLRLLTAAVRARGPLLVHDPATGAVARAAFVVLGVLTGRSRHLLWIDCSVPEALAGQRRRGRVLLGWSFSRHARNAPRTRARLVAGAVPRGWHTATVVERESARRGLRVERSGDVPGRRLPSAQR